MDSAPGRMAGRPAVVRVAVMAANRFSVLDSISEADQALARAMGALRSADDQLRGGDDHCAELADSADRVHGALDEARRALKILAGQVKRALPAEDERAA